MAEEFKNLVDMFQKSVKSFGSQPLFGTKRDGQWNWSTYGELGKKVDGLRGGLASLGIKRGDCVAIVANNREEWALLAYALFGLGAALVPMYEAVKADEWAFIANDCKAVAVVSGTKKVHESVKKLPESVPSLKHVIGIELPESDPLSFAALIKKGHAEPVEPIDPALDDTACLIYTSGTTGNPKGVILSHGNIVSNVNAVQHMLPIGTDDRSLSFLPWAHSFGHTCELHVMVSRGASIALAESPDKIVANLGEVSPTLLFSVPRIFNRLYDRVLKNISEKNKVIQGIFWSAMSAAKKTRNGEPTTLVESLALPIAKKIIFPKILAILGGRMKYAFSGGAALAKEIAEVIDAIGITVYEGYGLTETSPIATANRPGAHKIGSVGKPIEKVKIVIDKSQTSAEAKDGEIIIYGPNVMQGYFNRDQENKEAFTEDKGFRTGDLGFLDGEGFLFITGRLKELYKLQNGKYVAPAPLEEKIKLSPFIANAMVYGDNRLFNVALIVPDMPTLKSWAAEQGIDSADEAKLCEDKRVKAQIAKEIEKQTGTAKGFEEIKKIGLIPEDFTTENGMLTPSLKVKRRVVVERYKAKLDDLYN